MRFPVAVVLCLLAVLPVSARPFTLVTHNVENLFDVDGVAVYDDYQPATYTPAHFATKLQNIARVLARVNQGEGPDIIVFNEIELDQTPPADGKPVDPAAWLAAHVDHRYDELLERRPLPADLADASAALWLLKALNDHGMTGYTVITSDEQPGAYEGETRGRAIQNVIFSRFPVRAVRNHPTQNARTIVEAELDVAGHALFVFANHWKSGAGNPETEADRLANARTLRDRIDQLLARDANTDLIIAGDLNSHYNQRERYKAVMRETGINTVLRAQGNELAIRGKDRDLYNLWFELPREQRRSDLFRGEWGTLMHLIVSRGLYDRRGVRYVDNSFAVMALPGLNADDYGHPNRWSSAGPAGAGFSDHFPLYARLEVAPENDPDRWMPLSKPSLEDHPLGDPVAVDYASYDLKQAINPADHPADTDFRTDAWRGKVFRVEADTVPDKYLRVKLAGQVYDVFSHDRDVRDLLYRQREANGRLTFYGELGTYKGNWQFLVRDKSWVR